MDGTLLALTTRGVMRYTHSSVLGLTWRTGDGGAALVLVLLHHTVLPNWFDERTNPGTGDNMMTWSDGWERRILTLGSTWASGCDTCSWGRARWWRSVLPRCSVCIGSSSLTRRRLQISPRSPLTTTTLTIIWECQLSVAIPIVYWSWNKH